MGQWWNLANIDKGNGLWNGCGGKMEPVLAGGECEQLVPLLQRPQWKTFSASSQAIATSKRKNSQSLLVNMPQEVIDNITDRVADSPDEQDLIFLALSCGYFFRLLGQSAQQLLAQMYAPWAGDRIIFVGDYAVGFPEGVCSPEEQKEILEYVPEDDHGRQNPLFYIGEGMMATEDPVSPDDMYENLGIEVEAAEESRPRRYKTLDANSAKVGSSLYARLLLMLMQEKKATNPVLRNLVTKQYVRDSAIAASEHPVSLGEVLCTFALFTTDPSGTAGLEEAWAGHRFDITDEAEIAGQGWTDSSDEACWRLVETGWDLLWGRVGLRAKLYGVDKASKQDD